MFLHLNKLESPSPKDALCHVWLKFAQWFWRRRFCNFVNEFLLFGNYLHLKKGEALHLLKNLNPLHLRMLCAKFGWKMGKVNSQTDRQTADNRRSEKHTWAFSSGEIKITVVWHFDFSMLSVNGREAWFNAISFLHDDKMKTHPPFVCKVKVQSAVKNT